MTTTVKALGGGAQPASIDTSGKTTGGPALRVYGFDSEADALAAGYVCEGGPAMSVALITDAQIASGEWKAQGDPAALVVYTAPANMPIEGGYSVPVYPVNGWGSAPAPVAPLFDSAEIGAVNASTLVVTFSANVDASDYATGVTIKVNGTATSITSAIRQSDNHAKVNYLIPVLWHGSGDAVTWEYASGSGNIVAESGGAALEDVSAQSATNNCEYAALLDLQADTLALSDGDPVSTWADQSGQGHDFTQATGTAQPLKQTIGGKSVVIFDGNDDWMLGGNFADNLDSMTHLTISNFGAEISTKIFEDGCQDSIGWVFWRETFWLFTDKDNLIHQDTVTAIPGKALYTSEMVSRTELHIYMNGVLSDTQPNGGTVKGTGASNYSTSQPVRLCIDGAFGDCDWYSAPELYTYMLLSPAPSSANRAALEARLAARYGVTL